ncbi:hypothetical protein H4Q26_010033 [Puccinia striiformis f. sp. tritici PST-130]|nr:hypothetical protein H4Q26_010033 [Puccinia striiformis f. sp. tritici PST-130]
MDMPSVLERHLREVVVVGGRVIQSTLPIVRASLARNSGPVQRTIQARQNRADD